MPKIKIAPSILSANQAKLQEEINEIEDFSDLLQVDVMDNIFVPNITPQAELLKKFSTKVPLDIHFMVKEPSNDYIKSFINANKKLKGDSAVSSLVKFKKASATDLPFDKEEFTHLWSQATIYHVHDKDKALSEVYRVLKKGGIFVFDDLTKHAWAYRELSLLLRRPSGREAYPGDIFYCSHRLYYRENPGHKNSIPKHKMPALFYCPLLPSCRHPECHPVFSGNPQS